MTIYIGQYDCTGQLPRQKPLRSRLDRFISMGIGLMVVACIAGWIV